MGSKACFLVTQCKWNCHFFILWLCCTQCQVPVEFVIFFILWLCWNDCDVFHASGGEGACIWAIFFKLHVSALSFGPFFLSVEAVDCSKTGWTVSCQDGSEPSLQQPEATPTFWQLILRQKSVCNLESHRQPSAKISCAWEDPFFQLCRRQSTCKLIDCVWVSAYCTLTAAF